MSVLQRCRSAIARSELTSRTGRVTSCRGLVLEAEGPDAFLGEMCRVRHDASGAWLDAEVVGFRRDAVLLMPCGEVQGLQAGAEVRATGRMPEVPAGRGLLGRVIDPFGLPLDGRGPLLGVRRMPLRAPAPAAIRRARIERVFETGIRAIDACLTLGVGQRVGIFAGSGVGKSTLLGMLARRERTGCNVIALIGERGREVREFLEHDLGSGLARSVVVVATADQPALVRARAAGMAICAAESLRDAGEDVAFFLDSLTRLASAQREVATAAGEAGSVRGWPPSVLAALPQFLERAGCGEQSGSITALCTVLVEGDDPAEPLTDHVRSLLDGHLVLSRRLAQQGQFPAIDVPNSVSRLSRMLQPADHRRLAEDCAAILAASEGARDRIEFGGYQPGSDAALDRALRLAPEIGALFRQRTDETSALGETLWRLGAVLAP